MAHSVPNFFDAGDVRNYELNYGRFLSRGYAEDRARRTAVAQTSLMKGTAQLAQFGQGLAEDADLEGGQFVRIWGSSRPSVDNVLLHDNVLLPEWEQFAGALSPATANGRGYIRLRLVSVQLDQAVLDILLRSLETAPVRHLVLIRNGLGSHGINFVVGALRNNPWIEGLWVEDNRIESARDTDSLATAANEHPMSISLSLANCDMGQNNAATAAIIPSPYHLEDIYPMDNHIESHGAMLISNCLASNPPLEVLDLRNNLLNDGDAEVLAESLKTNTNLREPCLADNRITEAGIESLTQVVHSLSGLNELYDSNHTCKISVSRDGKEFISKVNPHEDPILNRKQKIWHALISNRHTYAQSLDDAPVRIMPTVLAFLQDEEISTAGGRLEALFCLVQGRSANLLGTRGIGPNLRRSERIRKRKLMQFGEK